MRITGASVAAIARQLALPEPHVVAELLAALRSVAGVQAGEAQFRQAFELARLDVLEGQAWAVLRSSVSDGEVRDKTATLGALDRLIRIGAQRSELSEPSGPQRPDMLPARAAARRAQELLAAAGLADA